MPLSKRKLKQHIELLEEAMKDANSATKPDIEAQLLAARAEYQNLYGIRAGINTQKEASSSESDSPSYARRSSETSSESISFDSDHFSLSSRLDASVTYDEETVDEKDIAAGAFDDALRLFHQDTTVRSAQENIGAQAYEYDRLYGDNDDCKLYKVLYANISYASRLNMAIQWMDSHEELSEEAIEVFSLLAFAIIHDSSTNPNSVEEMLEHALARVPNQPALLDILADAKHCMGKLDEAKQLYEKAISSEQKDLATFYNYATLLEDMGDQRAARDMLERAREMAPNDIEVLWRLSNLHDVLMDEVEAAKRVRHQLLACSPDTATACFELGKQAIQWGEKDRAVQHLRATLRLAPKDVNMMTSVASAYLDYDEVFNEPDAKAAAISLIEEAYQLDQNDVETKRLYAWFADVTFADLLELTRELAEAKPADDFLNLEYQWVAFLEGEHDEERLRKISQKNPDQFIIATEETIEEVVGAYYAPGGSDERRGAEYRRDAYRLASRINPDSRRLISLFVKAERTLESMLAVNKTHKTLGTGFASEALDVPDAFAIATDVPYTNEGLGQVFSGGGASRRTEPTAVSSALAGEHLDMIDHFELATNQPHAGEMTPSEKKRDPSKAGFEATRQYRMMGNAGVAVATKSSKNNASDTALERRYQTRSSGPV